MSCSSWIVTSTIKTNCCTIILAFVFCQIEIYVSPQVLKQDCIGPPGVSLNGKKIPNHGQNSVRQRDLNFSVCQFWVSLNLPLTHITQNRKKALREDEEELFSVITGKKLIKKASKQTEKNIFVCFRTRDIAHNIL